MNPHGAVIGLNTSGASRHLQFAIPAKSITRVLDDLLRHGRIQHAYLGIGTQPVRLPEPFADEPGRAARTAVIVVDVQPSSPAANALLVGDVILSLDGHAIADPLDLRAALRSMRIGQRVTASVVRAGQRLAVDVVIGERPERVQ